MEKKKILFIYNPRAGKAKIRSNLLDIIDIFAKAGYEVTAYPTQSRGDGIKAVTERKTGYYDLIVCSGGDGTLDEVVTGMMQCERKIPIGYVPAGSTNDFANSLHIPRNMINAAQVIVKGRNFACDIGTFNDDIFVYILPRFPMRLLRMLRMSWGIWPISWRGCAGLLLSKHIK